jgi:hypothetical protein
VAHTNRFQEGRVDPPPERRPFLQAELIELTHDVQHWPPKVDMRVPIREQGAGARFGHLSHGLNADWLDEKVAIELDARDSGRW